MNKLCTQGKALPAITLLTVGGCSDARWQEQVDVETVHQAIIFDGDDRIDVHQIASLSSPQKDAYQKVASATAILVDSQAVDCSDAALDCSVSTGAPRFEGIPLCADQAFAGQPAVVPPAVPEGRRCAAFLVGPNLVMTHGACLRMITPGLPFGCEQTKVVFGWEKADATQDRTTVPQQNVYSCRSVVDSQVGGPTDIPPFEEYALFMVDRPVVDASNVAVPPLTLRQPTEPKLSDTAQLGVAGHPIGLPLKLADDMQIVENTAAAYFRVTMDAETGQAGSPVFDLTTAQVEGIYSRIIEPRFVVRDLGGGQSCLEYRHCDTTTPCGTNDSNVVSRVSSAAEAIPPFPCTQNCTGPVDSDGDALPDSWETTGTAGGAPIDIHLLGADPMHKDMFLQIDWMVRPPAGTSPQLSFKPNDVVLRNLRQAFEDAPVWNPDGEPGIRIHIDAGAGSMNWDGTGWTPWVNPIGAQVAYRQFVGTDRTTTERAITGADGSTDYMNRAGGYRASGRGEYLFPGESFCPSTWSLPVCYVTNGSVFRYGLAADELWSGGPDGTNFGNPGVLFATSTGRLENEEALDPIEQQRLNAQGEDEILRTMMTMHEHGHNLGLDHGGDQPTPNRKPNYLSAMNYLHLPEGLLLQGPNEQAYVDFSRRKLPRLDETTLNEFINIQDPDNNHVKWWCRLLGGATLFKVFTDTGSGATMFNDPANPGAVNWNCSGITGFPPNDVQSPEAPQNPVRASINRDSTDTELLDGFNDWVNLVYNGAGVLGFADVDEDISIPGPPGPDVPAEVWEEELPSWRREILRQHPRAMFAVDVQRGTVPFEVQFDGSASYDLDGTIAEYQWDFGDGQTATTSSATTSHVYGEAAIRVARLTVVDNQGKKSRFFVRERIYAEPVAVSVWPMFRRVARHHGRSALSGPTTNHRRFTFTQSAFDISSSPAIGADGTLYVGSDDNRVYAINPNGTTKWSRLTGGDVDSSPAIGLDGVVFVGSDDDKLYALDPNDGSVLCTKHLGGLDVESSPVIGADGTVYVGSEDNRLHALDPNDCSTKWTVLTGGDVDSSPAVGPDGTVYVGSDDNKLYAVNPNGTVRWSRLTLGDVKSSPALSNDGAAVYVGSDDDHLWALDAQTGALLWKTKLGDRDVKSSPAVGKNGVIYVGSDSGDLYALNPSNGTIIWHADLGPDIQSSPAVDASGVVFVGSDDERVYAVNGSTGAVIWSFKTGGAVKSSPAIGPDGTVYVGSNDDNLYAFGS